MTGFLTKNFTPLVTNHFKPLVKTGLLTKHFKPQVNTVLLTQNIMPLVKTGLLANNFMLLVVQHARNRATASKPTQQLNSAQGKNPRPTSECAPVVILELQSAWELIRHVPVVHGSA